MNHEKSRKYKMPVTEDYILYHLIHYENRKKLSIETESRSVTALGLVGGMWEGRSSENENKT